MESSIKLYRKPELRNPSLIAAWSGMGAVALIAVNYLKQALGAEALGEILPHEFFSPEGVLVQDSVIQVPDPPESKFYYWDSEAGRDLLIFLGGAQPQRAYELGNLVLDVAEGFGVKRVYTSAAFPLWVRPAREPNVWGAVTRAELMPSLRRHGVLPMREGSISGLNGLLLGAAKQRGIEGICLLGEMPIYATQTANPKAAQAVLEVLTGMLGIRIDLGELAAWAEQVEPEMEQLYAALPDQAKALIEQLESSIAAFTSPELEVDDELFDEIERFLREQRGRGKGL